MTTRLYHAHGLIMASDVEVSLPPAPAGFRVPDLTVRIGGTAEVPNEPVGDQVLAELVRGGRRVYHFARRADRVVVLRYPGVCDLVGDATLSEVTAWLHPGADPGLLGVLAGGNLLAVHLMLRRHLVLHASAVRCAGRVMALVGASGMGKSTLAAAYCATGAELVTDDVLRVDLHPDGRTLVHPGATENRLRTGPGAGVDRGVTGSVRRAADGRLAVRSRRRIGGAVTLDACVVPLVRDGPGPVEVRPLRASAAMRWLIRFPKVAGWCEPESLRWAFQALGTLVERVPVFEVSIPRGLPVTSDVLADLVTGTFGPVEAADPLLSRLHDVPVAAPDGGRGKRRATGGGET